MKTNMEDVKMNMELMKWEFARIDTKLLVLEGNCEWLKGNVAIFTMLIVIVIVIGGDRLEFRWSLHSYFLHLHHPPLYLSSSQTHFFAIQNPNFLPNSIAPYKSPKFGAQI